jgi:hypothetical protein
VFCVVVFCVVVGVVVVVFLCCGDLVLYVVWRFVVGLDDPRLPIDCRRLVAAVV